MSIETDVKAIKHFNDDMEEWLNARMRNIVETTNTGVAASVLINLGTTMLAKAIILARDQEHKARVIEIIGKVLNAKVDEGETILESMLADPESVDLALAPDDGIRH